MGYKSNRNIVYSCKYHVVWCPKFRRPVLVKGVDSRLKTIVAEVVAETRSELIELEVMPDHVHLLVEVEPQFGIHKLVKTIKDFAFISNKGMHIRDTRPDWRAERFRSL